MGRRAGRGGTSMSSDRIPYGDAPLTPASFLAAQLCWAVDGVAAQLGLRPINSMFVGGSGSGVSPSGPSA